MVSMDSMESMGSMEFHGIHGFDHSLGSLGEFTNPLGGSDGALGSMGPWDRGDLGLKDVADCQIHSHHFTSAVLPPFTWHKIELEIRWGSHVPTGFYSTVGQRLANRYRASLSIIQVLMQMN